MARPRQPNLVSRLADAGEEAIHRLADAPGADLLMGAMTSMRERMDDMQKRIRGLEALERRIGALERRLDKVEGKGTASTRRVATTTASKSGAKGTTRKTGSSPPARPRSTTARRKTGES
jgi:hypothetical protein